MKILEKFVVSDGTTILACAVNELRACYVGEKFNVVLDGEVKQTLTISGERKMLNQKSNHDHRAFETKDVVSLSQAEAQCGEWQLVKV